MSRPKGGVVLIAGPDGAGKTTLANSLAGGALRGRPVLLIHHREAKVLPARRMQGSGTEPHRHPPYPMAVSMFKLLYLFVDFHLAWALRISPFRRRGGWVLLQRNWWDVVVDPRRYRLRPSPRLSRALARLLPQPDLTLVLDATPSVIAQRKQELSRDELERQTQTWRALLRGRPGVRMLDASLPQEELTRRASEEVSLLEAGADWISLPRRTDPRWTLHRSRTSSGLSIYQPVRLRGLVGWTVSRLLAGAGLLRMLPRGRPPPAELEEIVRRYVPRGRTVAVTRSSHPGRQIALIVGPDGDRQIAKVGYSETAQRALEREAGLIRELGPSLPPPAAPPIILAEAPGLLLLRGVRPRPAIRPWRLPPEVAFALGRFFRTGATGDPPRRGPAHGDVAPWNLIRTDRGWTLVDWEHARLDAPPFHDVSHWLFQSYTLLGRPSRRALLAGFGGRGWVGRAIEAYAGGAGLDPAEAPGYFLVYLQGRADLDGQGGGGRDELRRAIRAVSGGRP